MSDSEEISLQQFLDEKDDYSPLLVHLTKDDEPASAKDVLQQILNDHKLKAYNAWCIWRDDLNKPENNQLLDEFKVVCFTETPIDQIEVLLKRVENRQYCPEPYGLVFKKEYIKQKGGNPVFYVTKKIATPLHDLYADIKSKLNPAMCKLLALTTICQKYNDWHWEREWRIVKDFNFKYEDVYCGLCPAEDIPEFKNNYPQIKFISPYWSKKKLLDEFVKKSFTDSLTIDPEDLPF